MDDAGNNWISCIPVLLNLHIMLNNTGLTPFEKYEWPYTLPHFQPFKRADEEAGETLAEKNTWELPLTKNIHTVNLILAETTQTRWSGLKKVLVQIPNNTAPDESVTKALEGVATMHVLCCLFYTSHVRLVLNALSRTVYQQVKQE